MLEYLRDPIYHKHIGARPNGCVYIHYTLYTYGSRRDDDILIDY